MKLITSFVVFVLAFYLCVGSPVYKDENKLLDFKRRILNDPDASVTDKIVVINQDLHPKGLFEGDIVLTDHDHVDTSESGDIDGPIKSKLKRNAQRSRQNLWTTRVVPYEIDSVITDSEATTIKNAIAAFNKLSCLQWNPKKTGDHNWVKFVKKSGCYSSVGRKYWTEGFQELSLGGGCYGTGTIHHEMLHASGFWHEQSRPDRNEYVQVLWENILVGQAHNFNKYSHGDIDTLKKSYDFDSVMHYGKYGFSKNGQPTLLPFKDPNQNFGQREGLSSNDVLELKALYDCTTPKGGWTDWADYSPCDSQCYKYRQRFCTAENRATVCPEANSYGVQTEYMACPKEECYAPVNGHWGRWSSWGACSTTCGDGRKTRTRLCDDPTPKNGGAQCVGSSMENLECKVRSCGLGPDDCEFESSLCNWAKDSSSTSQYPWTRHTGKTPSSDTGPPGDHTSGSGYYIFAEASSPVETGQTARIISKVFPPTSGRCMNFWYSMYGLAMGALNVYVKNADTNTLEKQWSLSGNQGKEWKNASINIQSSTKYSVMFESVRGIDYRGDIALDDITFKDGSCAIQVQADLCDFGRKANVYCSWLNDPTNDKTPDNYYQFNWLTNNGSTPSSDTGPPSGHGGSGYYAYLESSSPFQEGMKGRLISKLYQASSNMCFDFWYYMYGSGIGGLKVNLENTSGQTNLWSESGNKGASWLHKKLAVSSQSAFKIIVEGTRGSSYLGDIAIDDLRVSHGSCV